MTIFATSIYFDRTIHAARLADVFASASSVSVDRVRVISRDEFERAPAQWFPDSVTVGLQTSAFRGDFPFEAELIYRSGLDVRAVLHRVARDLNTAILTDTLDDDLFDSGWRMIMPDGSSAIVFADTDELDTDDPAIILEPTSRAIYDAKRADSHPVTIGS